MSTTTAKGRMFCRECCKTVAIAEYVNEKQEQFDTAGDPIVIYWKFWTGTCGHTLRDDSH